MFKCVCVCGGRVGSTTIKIKNGVSMLANKQFGYQKICPATKIKLLVASWLPKNLSGY